MKHCNLILLLSFFTLLSCSRGEVSIREALLFAGENKQEMKTVLRHYREEDPDPEKYEAARFLIRNMPFHHSYEPQAYREYCDSLIAVFTGN